MLDQTVTENDK